MILTMPHGQGVLSLLGLSSKPGTAFRMEDRSLHEDAPVGTCATPV